MNQDLPVQKDLDRFILEEILSVPHLEAILLLWKTRPGRWLPEDMSKALHIPEAVAARVLLDLAGRRLVMVEAESFFYQSGSAFDTLLGQLDETYRRELVRISRMIHSRGRYLAHESDNEMKLTGD